MLPQQGEVKVEVEARAPGQVLFAAHTVVEVGAQWDARLWMA